MKNLKPKDVNKYFWLIFGLGILVMLASIANESIGEIAIILGSILVMSGFVFRIIFYRCPHCGQYLDRSTGDYCPRCGKPVNE